VHPIPLQPDAVGKGQVHTAQTGWN